MEQPTVKQTPLYKPGKQQVQQVQSNPQTVTKHCINNKQNKQKQTIKLNHVNQHPAKQKQP